MQPCYKSKISCPHPCWIIHCWCFSIMCFDAGFKAVYRKLWCSALSTSPLCCALALPLSRSKGWRALRLDTWQSRTGSGMFVLQWKMHSACCHKGERGAICVGVCVKCTPSPPFFWSSNTHFLLILYMITCYIKVHPPITFHMFIIYAYQIWCIHAFI